MIFLLPAILAVYFGIQLHVVTTGSMRPEIQPGDVLVTHLKTASAIQKGEIILLFNNESQRAQSHRVVDISYNSNLVTFTTQGDANPLADSKVEDPSLMPIQTVAYVVPKIGYLLVATHSHQGLLLGGIAFLILIFFYFIPSLKRASAKLPKIQTSPEKYE
jgi:signal peptidase